MTYQEKVPQHNPDRDKYEGTNKGPYDHTKYAQCDYVLTKKEHFHTVIDCQVQMSKAKNTDHYPLMGTIESTMKLAKTTQKRKLQREQILETGCSRNAGMQQNSLRTTFRINAKKKRC